MKRQFRETTEKEMFNSLSFRPVGPELSQQNHFHVVELDYSPAERKLRITM
jgi:hypothetical protein